MTNSCIDRNRLRDYLQGRLADEESGSIAVHLESCGRCGELADKVEQDSDWLLNHLSVAGSRHTAVESPSWIPQVQQAVGESPPKHEAAAEDTPDNRTGLFLGAYEIQELIGRGGMGYVYRATHRKLGKAVALKVVSAPAAPTAGPRFEREMRAIGALNHPAIVQATDADSSGERAFLVMELIDGVDLRTLIQKHGPLSPSDACEIIRQAADGLRQAHEAGVVHRDVKPSNLMLTRSGQVKILDFGLAQMREDLNAASLTTSLGHVIGTIDYLSPEQTDGSTVDARADVYGLGATLFTLLTGRPPFGRSADVPLLSHLRRVATEDAPPLSDFRKDVPAELDRLLAQMIARDKQTRIQTAEDVQQKLAGLSADHSLPQLAESAASLVPRTNMSTAELKSEAAQTLANLNNRSQWPRESNVETKLQAEKKPRGAFVRTLFATLAMLAIVGLGGWLGATIVLNTGQGELRIESQVEDVEISVLRDSQPQMTVELKQNPQSVELRAGLYEVIVKHAVDAVRVSQKQVRVMRGEQVVVTITRVPSTAPTEEMVGDQVSGFEALGAPVQDAATPQDAAPTPVIAQPVPMSPLQYRLAALDPLPSWDGRTLREWVDVMTITEPEQERGEAIEAVTHLAPDVPPELAAELLLRAGSITVNAFVDDNPDNVSAVVAAEPALWDDDTPHTDPVQEHLEKLVLESSPFAEHCPKIVESLSLLPLDRVAVAVQHVSRSDLAARAILLRSTLRHALTTPPNPKEAKAAESWLFMDRSGMQFNGAEGMARSEPLECLVISTLDERRTQFLRLVFARPDLGQTSALAAIALRLSRRAPQDLPAVNPADPFVRAVAYDQLRLATAMLRSTRVRPIQPISTGTYLQEMVPVLESTLEKPGFVATLMDPRTIPLDILTKECYENWSNTNQRRKAVEFYERVLERLVAWRDTAELDQRLGNGEEYLLSERFNRIAELLVCITGKLPAGLETTSPGSGSLPQMLRDWKAGNSTANRPALDADARVMLSNWFPCDVLRSAFAGRDFSELGITRADGDGYRRLAPAIWLATAADAVKRQAADEKLLASLLRDPGSEQSGGAFVLTPWGTRVAAVIRRHSYLRGTPSLQLVMFAKSEELKVAALATAERAYAVRNFADAAIAPLLLSDDLPIALQAMRWLQHPNSWNGENQIAAVEQLTRPGFLQLGELTVLPADPTQADHLFERLVLLQSFSLKYTGAAAAELAAAIRRWAESEDLPANYRGLAHTGRNFIGVGKTFVGHPFTPAMNLIALHPKVAVGNREVLATAAKLLEEHGHFRGKAGLELRAAVGRALHSASGPGISEGGFF